MLDRDRRDPPHGAARPSRIRRDHSLRYALVIVGVWMAISGCASAPVTPLLSPSPEQVGVGPSLEPFASARVAAYRQAVGVPPFDLTVWSDVEGAHAAQAGRIQLLVSAEPPPTGWFATPLGIEGIAIVVNPSIRVRKLSLRQLGDVFGGIIRGWDEIGGQEQPIQLVIPPQGDGLRRQFEVLVMDGRSFARTATLAPTPAAMADLVDQTPGAIGLLPLSFTSGGTRKIAVDGQSPSPSNLAAGSYPLAFEVIATAPAEPSGGLRGWLAWVQAQE